MLAGRNSRKRTREFLQRRISVGQPPQRRWLGNSETMVQLCIGLGTMNLRYPIHTHTHIRIGLHCTGSTKKRKTLGVRVMLHSIRRFPGIKTAGMLNWRIRRFLRGTPAPRQFPSNTRRNIFIILCHIAIFSRLRFVCRILSREFEFIYAILIILLTANDCYYRNAEIPSFPAFCVAGAEARKFLEWKKWLLSLGISDFKD